MDSLIHKYCYQTMIAEIMDYKKIYNQLIARGKDRVPKGYVERHHIHPKCMGGADTKENLVALYPEEHFTAHVLLLKIHKHTKHRYALAKAINKMTVGHKGKRCRKLYGWLKRELSLAMSALQTGEGNSQFGSMWICNIVLQQNKKIPKDDPIPDGWVKGRIVNKETSYLLYPLVCSVCGKTTRRGYRTCSEKCRKLAIGNAARRKTPEQRYQSNRSKFKSVEIDGVYYESISRAAGILGFQHETLRMRLKNPNYKNYNYIRD